MPANQASQIKRDIASKLRRITSQPELEAEILLCHVLGISREQLLVNPEIVMSMGKHQRQKLDQMVADRLKHKPLQYILGYKWFYGNKFRVNEHTFIPRDDTEILVKKAVELAIESIQQNPSGTFRVADICTGSGAILISLLYALQETIKNSPDTIFEFIGVDLSKNALEVAKQNQKTIVPKLPKNAQINFIQSDLFERIKGKFHLIVSNPPYIPQSDQKTWQKELDYEPKQALVSGSDGMDAYNRLIPALPQYLTKNDVFIGEIHPPNYSKIQDLAHLADLRISLRKGLVEEKRFVVIRQK